MNWPMAFWVLSLVAMMLAAHLGFLCGKRQRQPVRPFELLDICPMPYVAFAPGTREIDRIAFLENILRELKAGALVTTARLDQEAGDDA